MKKKLANKITNFGLVFIAIMALPYNIITFFALQDSEYQIIRVVPLFLAFVVIILAFFRKRITLMIKARFFLITLLLAALFCLLLGLLDTASLWFVLAIIYTLFTGQRNHAFYLFILAFVSILFIGTLMVTKNPYIPFDYGFEDCQFACVAIRIFDFLVIGFLIYYIIKTFLSTIDRYIDQEIQKTSALKKLNLALKNEMNEKQINKELKATLEQKNRELVVNTLKLLRKSEYDNELIATLKVIAKASSETTTKKLKKLIQQAKMNKNTIIWEEFEKQFIEVNTSFYKKLFEKHPNLTKNDKKICAFIKLNMDTKDIASMLHISIRGVETARYRLRKTMQIKHNKNLYQYLQNL